MSCNRGVSLSQPAADAMGCPALESTWSAARHKTLAAAAAPSPATAITAPPTTPVRQTLSCGHQVATTVASGGEEWCSHCDDWQTVEPPRPPEPGTAYTIPSPTDETAMVATTEYGEAAYQAQHDGKKTRHTYQEKVKSIGYAPVTAALRAAGVPSPGDNTPIYNMVWQYLDRCKCGAWISPRNPVCANPRCGDRGKTVGSLRPWPPVNVTWVDRKQWVGYTVGSITPTKTPRKAAAPPAAAAGPAPSPAAPPPAASPMPVAPPPVATSTPDRIELANPNLAEVEAAWRSLKAAAGFGAKYLITFKDPVRVQINQRKAEMMAEMEVGLFEGQGSGAMCYTFHRSTGYRIANLPYEKITSIAIVPAAKIEAARVEQVKQLANSIHPNAWPDLKARLLAEPEKHTWYGLGRISMRQVFGDEIVKQLEEAFENKTDYRFSLPGEKRDRRVEVRVREDGAVHAWYSSEYAGTGNGDYYYLLNPYTASFKESD